MQMDILLRVRIIFKNSNKLSYFRIQQIKLSFIHIRISHTYIEFHNLYMHKNSYTLIIFKHLFFTV